MALYFLINLLLTFLLFSSLWEPLSCMSNSFQWGFCYLITIRNENFPCTLFNLLWAWKVSRHVKYISHLGAISLMLIFIDHHWLTSCNFICIRLISIWIFKICIKSFSKWHSFHKVNLVFQLYIPLVRYWTIEIWLNTLYLMHHLMNLPININNSKGITKT